MTDRKKSSKNTIITSLCIIAAFIVLLISTSSNNKVYVNIEDNKRGYYSILDREENKEVDIFFWYGCPHCLNLSKSFNDIKLDKKISGEGNTLTMTPLPANSVWELHARLYYSLNLLNADKHIHIEIMNEIQTHGHKDVPSITKMIKSLSSRGYLTSGGMDLNADKVISNMSSEEVSNEIYEASAKARELSITSVPTVIVNGNKKVEMNPLLGYRDTAKVIELILQSNN